MDLDRTYFNSIRLNTHRGKYYDVDAVDRLLVDIRSKADLLMKEVRTSREQHAEAEKTVDALRDENTDLFLKGQALSQEILALREELRAAQSGEASLIPEEDESAAGEKDFVAEEPDQEETPAWGEEEDFYYLTEELPEPTKPEKTFEADQTDSKAIRRKLNRNRKRGKKNPVCFWKKRNGKHPRFSKMPVRSATESSATQGWSGKKRWSVWNACLPC